MFLFHPFFQRRLAPVLPFRTHTGQTDATGRTASLIPSLPPLLAPSPACSLPLLHRKRHPRPCWAAAVQEDPSSRVRVGIGILEEDWLHGTPSGLPGTAACVQCGRERGHYTAISAQIHHSRQYSVSLRTVAIARSCSLHLKQHSLGRSLAGSNRAKGLVDRRAGQIEDNIPKEKMQIQVQARTASEKDDRPKNARWTGDWCDDGAGVTGNACACPGKSLCVWLPLTLGTRYSSVGLQPKSAPSIRGQLSVHPMAARGCLSRSSL